jgi:hypothetical protein
MKCLFILVLSFIVFFSCDQIVIEKGYVVSYDVQVVNASGSSSVNVVIDGTALTVNSTKTQKHDASAVTITYAGETKTGYFTEVALFNAHFNCK